MKNSIKGIRYINNNKEKNANTDSPINTTELMNNILNGNNSNYNNINDNNNMMNMNMNNNMMMGMNNNNNNMLDMNMMGMNNNNMMGMNNNNMMGMNNNMMNNNIIDNNMIDNNMMGMNNNMMNNNMMTNNTNQNLNNIQGTSIQALKHKQKEDNPPSIASKSHNSNHTHNTNLSLNDKIIDTLVTDVNASFDDYSPSDEKEYDTETDKEDEKINYNKIIEYLYEPILLLVIYFILSQEKIRDIFMKYIPLLNPTDGEIKQSGIILYGIILVGLFMLSKKILLNK